MGTMMTMTHEDKIGNDQKITEQTEACERTYQSMFVPRFDFWEGNDELVLYFDLPGVDPDHLDIQFENRQLTLHGKICRHSNGVDYLRSEYGVGDFHRTFLIGESINIDAVSAELKDGILTLRLPKAEDAKPRRIEVKAN
jgi:HSP20 family protein